MHHSHTSDHGGASIGSGQDGSRVYRLRQSQPGQDQHGVGGHRDAVPLGRRIVQGNDRCCHDARALSRRRFRDYRLAGRASAGFFSGVGTSIEYISTGKVRALAVTTAVRLEALPDVPTVGEFVPGYEASTWYGVGAPRSTSAEIVEKLNRQINAAVADPIIKARLVEQGGTVFSGSPADFGKLIADDSEKWAKVIRGANIKPE